MGRLKEGEEFGGEVGRFLATQNLASIEELSRSKDEEFDPITQIETKVKIIIELSKQIRNIWNDRSYLLLEDPYKMPVRLAVLSHLLGYQPVTNCVSEKDRTSLLDLEVKYLLTYIALNKKVPRPMVKLTEEAKIVYSAIGVFSGILAVQENNHGVGGYLVPYAESKKLDPLYQKTFDSTAYTWLTEGGFIYQKMFEI